MTRERRHRVIRRVLQANTVRSQDQLQHELAEQGIEVAQPTLSRDLRQLGVVKGPSGYHLNGSSHGESFDDAVAALQEACADYTESIRHAGQLVVIKTGPGRAQALAVAVDAYPSDELLGTVAGDDTIFIACASETIASRLAGEMTEWAGLA